MLEYDRIDVSERIDVNKTSGSRDCIICHYWYFLDINFNFNDVPFVSIKRNDYRFIFGI